MEIIRFKPRGKWQEAEVANRLAKVIGYTDYCPPFSKDSGYKWQLNASNDWWMGVDQETGEYILAGRYASQKLMDALKVLTEWIFE